MTDPIADWNMRMTREREWLAGLKAGDAVAISHHYGMPTLTKVTHATATQVHVNSSKFRRKDGRVVGDNWSRSSLCEPTAEIRQQIEERRLRNSLADVKWQNLTLEQVKAVLAITTPAHDSSGDPK